MMPNGTANVKSFGDAGESEQVQKQQGNVRLGNPISTGLRGLVAGYDEVSWLI
jgi:hypothetical protein